MTIVCERNCYLVAQQDAFGVQIQQATCLALFDSICDSIAMMVSYLCLHCSKIERRSHCRTRFVAEAVGDGGDDGGYI